MCAFRSRSGPGTHIGNSMSIRFIALILLGCALAAATTLSGEVQLSASRFEVYLGKFAFSPDAPGEIRGFISVVDPSPHATYNIAGAESTLQFVVLDDFGWIMWHLGKEQGHSCPDRMRLATARGHLSS